MDKLLYGVAYYDEYMPYERLQEDIKMMKEAGINVLRIAENLPGVHWNLRMVNSTFIILIGY